MGRAAGAASASGSVKRAEHSRSRELGAAAYAVSWGVRGYELVGGGGGGRRCCWDLATDLFRRAGGLLRQLRTAQHNNSQSTPSVSPFREGTKKLFRRIVNLLRKCVLELYNLMILFFKHKKYFYLYICISSIWDCLTVFSIYIFPSHNRRAYTVQRPLYFIFVLIKIRIKVYV